MWVIRELRQLVWIKLSILFTNGCQRQDKRFGKPHPELEERFNSSPKLDLVVLMQRAKSITCTES